MVASKNVRWDPQREEAAWRIGVLDKVLDVTETLPRELHDGHLMTRGVRTFWTVVQKHTTKSTDEEVTHHFNCSSEGHRLDCHLKTRKKFRYISASLTTDDRRRLRTQRECYKSYSDEEKVLQRRRREMHRSRPWRLRSSGESWFWRSRARSHRRTVKSRQFKERTFLGPARVLLPERIGTREGSKCQATAWIVVGDQVVRCSTAHMRPLTNAEQTLCSLRDGETTSFQEPA